jgi:hypothetical protein
MPDDLFADIAAHLAGRRTAGLNNHYYWGGCPVCLAPGEVLFFDEHRGEWFVCLPCGVRWWTGSGNFSSWHDLTLAERQHHQDVLNGLRVVEAYMPPAVMAQRLSAVDDVEVIDIDELPLDE